MTQLFLDIVIVWACMALVMAGLWFVQYRGGMAGLVDVAWGMGVAAAAAYFAWKAIDAPLTRRWAVCLVVGIWATRLSGHVLVRLWRSGEDGRYAQLMQDWGDAAQSKLFGFFQMQAAASVLFALPMRIALTSDAAWSTWDLMGVSIGSLAIFGEAVADWQLSRFKADPQHQGRVCDVGLWRYSRHPNYFFEWLHWWAYVALAWESPWGWINIVFPMIMLYFILYKTGIPPTEAQSLRSRGEAYRRYQERTSAFFPWFPRKDSP